MACEDRPITGLLPEQQAAAAHRQGHARLLAGPGTGKTRTLVALIAGLIQDGTACADEILCLTFTRAAAAGLRAKVAHAIAPAEPPTVYTMHGYALRQLMAAKHQRGLGAWARPGGRRLGRAPDCRGGPQGLRGRQLRACGPMTRAGRQKRPPSAPTRHNLPYRQ